MKLGDIEQSATRSQWFIRANQSPDNNAQLSSELLLSGDSVHYIQPVNTERKIILDCYDKYSIYQQVLALSQLRTKVLLDTGLELIMVIFDYSQNPCVEWKNTPGLGETEQVDRDYFTVYLKAV
jgi:hypothetical protein